jgi:urease accessory protein
VQLEAVLRLCHLVSPAVPVGAYAYSQGLEYAVQAGWVTDESSALEWLQGLSRHSLATLELPLLMRLHRAWSDGDDTAVQHWNAQLLARRETAELRAEELHLGRSLAKVLCEFDMVAAHIWRDASPSLAAMFALAAVNWKIPAVESAGGYLWMWSENQVLAGVKLIPLGQSAGQRLLHALIAEMPALVNSAASVADDDISTGAISLGLASALHETQYTRLFRS